MKSGPFGHIIRENASETSQNARDQLKQQIDEINDITQKVTILFFFRSLYSKEFCTTFFQEHLDLLSAEQSFNLLTERVLSFDEKCRTKFISTLEEQDAVRKSNPGMRTYPDWLMITIEECIVLRLLGFDVDLAFLAPYAHYSTHLSFMVDPESFDYSQVNTADYMWQNLIFAKEYQPYFVSHKCDVLSDDLKKIFDLGVATEEQQKIVYGILLDQDELQCFD